MANFTKLAVREHYASNDEDIRDRMGPMKFPILDSAIELGVGSCWSVSRYFYPRNRDELRSVSALVKGSGFEATREEGVVVSHTPTGNGSGNIILANAAQGKITVIRGDWTLQDIGLEVRQELEFDAEGNICTSIGKEAKRMKAFARPFRIHTRRDDGLRVLVVEAKGHPALLDGASLISEELVLDCIDNLDYPQHKFFNYGIIRTNMLEQKVFNGVLLGRLIDVETGQNLNTMGKGQYVRCPLPEGVDIVTSPDNLKIEIVGTGPAFIGIEPQGPKAAREDQQTVANQQFLCPTEDGYKRLNNDADSYLEYVFSGQFRESSKTLSSPIYRSENAFNETSFAAIRRWRTEAWALHGISYLDSPWLTTQISEMWTRTLGYNTNNWDNTLKINIPCAIRAQIVSLSLVNLWRTYTDLPPLEVEDGDLAWDEELSFGVVSDNDWVNIVVPSHGGCDLDDFFVIRWVEIDGEYKIIIHRSPNARGEYSIWNYVPGNWYPEYITQDGTAITFPHTSLDSAPMQILEALETGITEYIPLPSETREKPESAGHQVYDNASCIKAIEQVMNIQGGYGQYELAVRARNSIDPHSFDTHAINSESAIDSFAQAGSTEDQKFILADRDRIVNDIVKGLVPVDAYIGPRLGNNNIMSTGDGPIAQLKKVCLDVIAQYRARAHAQIAQLKEPEWLQELGENQHIGLAKRLLKHARASMWQANISTDPVTGVVSTAANVDQNTILCEYFEKIEDEEVKHQFALAFWHACWTTPTSAGKITDQPVFGTDVYDYVLEAMVYYGVAWTPFINGEGMIERRDLMSYIGEGWHTSICRTCGDEIEFETKYLSKYWESNGSCKTCCDT